MALELKDESATWTITDADLIQGGDKETTYTIRRLTLEKHREIRRRHTSKPTYRRQYEHVNEEAFQDDLFDYVLVGWSGVIVNGKEAPCDSAHRALLDVPRRIQILDAAGMNEIRAQEDARDASFRATA